MTRTSDLARPDVLVLRRHHLLVAREVDPELDAVEEPAGLDQPLGWRLDVEDAGAGGHPLGVTVGDLPAAAL
jgi:hypothetical protein